MKAATGEVISAEELGGAETHGRKSGVVDYVAENDEHALEIVRGIVGHLNSVKRVDLDVREPRAAGLRRRRAVRPDPRRRARPL